MRHAPRSRAHSLFASRLQIQGAAFSAALLVGITVLAGSHIAHAQADKDDEANKADKADKADKAHQADKASKDAEQAAQEQAYQETLAVLLRLESKVAQGTALTSDEIALVLEKIKAKPAPDAGNSEKPQRYARIRATAAAILPWLSPDISFVPLQESLMDDDALVRYQAVVSMGAVIRRLDEEQRQTLPEILNVLVDDNDDEVFCAAAELFYAIAPAQATDRLNGMLWQATPLRAACISRLISTPLPPYATSPLPVRPVVPTDQKNETPTPNPTNPKIAKARQNGEWISLLAASSAGLVAGGALPSALVPPQNLLVYRRDLSRYVQVEASILLSAASAATGAAVLGFGMQWVNDQTDITYDGGTSAALGVLAGSFVGAGASMAIANNAQIFSGATAAGVLGGLAIGTATAVWGQPSWNDTSFALTSGALGWSVGTLGMIAALPVALTDVGLVTRIDFALGMGFVLGGGLTLGALPLAAAVDIPADRSYAALTGALALGGTAMLASYAIVPQDVDVRQRIAAGAGALGAVVGAGLGAWLIPPAWMGVDTDAASKQTPNPSSAAAPAAQP